MVILGILILLLVTGGTAWRCSTNEHDPRAYEGSLLQSLGEVSNDYYLRFPTCTEKTVRYGLYGQLRLHTLYVYFAGDNSCIAEFLKINGLDDEKTYEWEGLKFVPTTEEFGWPQDPAKKYVALDGDLHGEIKGSSIIHMQIAIDYAVQPYSLYLRASSV